MNDRLSGLARNPSLPAHLLDQLIQFGDDAIDGELVKRADLTLAHAQRLAGRGCPYIESQLVARGLLTAADVDSQKPAVLLALAQQGDSDALLQLTDHPDLEVVEDVALSPQLTRDLAIRLASHPHMTVRRTLAANERTPSELLERLADGSIPAAQWCFGCDGTPYCCDECRSQHWKCEGGSHEYAVMGLRITLAANQSTPPAALAGWADDPYTFLREAVAGRTGLPTEVYHRLAADSVPLVRAALAKNPAIGDDLMRAMAADTTHDVQRSLAHNPALPLDLLGKLAPVTKIGPTLLPRIANATHEDMESLAASKVPQVRMLLAERLDLPDGILQRLAQDSDPMVLKSLAPNPALSVPQLQSIVDRHGVRVAARVAMNPSCPPDLLLRLARLSPQARKSLRPIASHPNSPAEALVLCLWEPHARQVAAVHPALPHDVLQRFLEDPDCHVALAAAANPALPVHLMKQVLEQDRHSQADRGERISQ